jgi:hypothetical protein
MEPTKEWVQQKRSELWQLQSQENDGRGIRCVQDICFYLFHGDFNKALAVRQLDGDKTRSYPNVELLLTEIFGCRLHGVHNCNGWLCKQ